MEFIENENRFTLFPIKYHDIFDMYKKHCSTFWLVEEIDLSKDIDDWNTLNSNEKHFIKHILAFFAASDGIVNENLLERFAKEIPIPEVRAFYTIQQAMETIHSETYSLLIETYISDGKEKDTLFNAMFKIESIKLLTQWALKWISSTDSLPMRLVAFACVEGILFSGPFCAIFWLKDRGLMSGLTFSNELISRDESLHTEFAILLYTQYSKRLSQTIVHDIIKEAVHFETVFITESIPCALLGMSAQHMTQYIEFIGDRLAIQLGYEPIYNSKNPFPFMDKISMNNKTNFFEKKVAEYSKAQITPSNMSKLNLDTLQKDDF